jgi:hypothetical protein
MLHGGELPIGFLQYPLVGRHRKEAQINRQKNLTLQRGSIFPKPD